VDATILNKIQMVKRLDV